MRLEEKVIEKPGGDKAAPEAVAPIVMLPHPTRKLIREIASRRKHNLPLPLDVQEALLQASMLRAEIRKAQKALAKQERYIESLFLEV